MAKKQELIKTLTITKFGTTLTFQTTVYDIGIYIDKSVDGEIHNRTTRNTISKANNYILKAQQEFQAMGWEISELKHTIVIENTNKLPLFEER